MSKFREGQLVVYKNGSRCAIGKVKRVVEDGAFVFYHEGETAAKTQFDCMFPLENEHCIKHTSLGGGERWKGKRIRCYQRIRLD